MNLDIEKCDHSLDSSHVSEVHKQYRIHIFWRETSSEMKLTCCCL